MTTIEQRVAAGAKFLDEHDPEWWRADVERAIDLDTLNMSKGAKCILGQRCPLEVANPEFRYEDWASELSGLGYRWRIDEWAVEYGFQAAGLDEGPPPVYEYNALTAEWKRVITGRRSAS